MSIRNPVGRKSGKILKVLLLYTAYNKNLVGERLNLSNEEIGKVLKPRRKQKSKEFLSEPQTNNEKLEIFMDMLNITSNTLLIAYLVYIVHLSTPDWLKNTTTNISNTATDIKQCQRQVEFIRSYYNHFNTIITMELIYLSFSIFFFIYDMAEISFLLKVITYVTLSLGMIATFILLYTSQGMETEIKEYVSYRGYIILPISLLNFILMWGKSYLKNKNNLLYTQQEETEFYTNYV